MTDFQDLLFIKTHEGKNIQTLCRYKTHDYIYPTVIKNVLTYYLELHNKSLATQTKVAKRLLDINKLVPLYIHKQLVLFPLKQKRAPIQYYINAHYIIGLKSKRNLSTIQFENGHYLIVDEQFYLVLKKLKESCALKYLLTKN